MIEHILGFLTLLEIGVPFFRLEELFRTHILPTLLRPHPLTRF